TADSQRTQGVQFRSGIRDNPPQIEGWTYLGEAVTRVGSLDEVQKNERSFLDRGNDAVDVDDESVPAYFMLADGSLYQRTEAPRSMDHVLQDLGNGRQGCPSSEPSVTSDLRPHMVEKNS